MARTSLRRSLQPFSHGLPKGEDAIRQYAEGVRSFYDSRARWHRRFFRWTGTYLIISGSALPLLAALQYEGKELAVSLVGVSVATLTGLRAFYRWDRSWILLRRTEIAMSNAILAWQTARQANGADAAELDAQLLQTISDLRQNESDAFFKEISLPQSSTTRSETEAVVVA